MSYSPARFQTSSEVLPDGSFPFPVTITTSVPEAVRYPSLKVVFANGQGCDSSVARRLMQGVASVATAEGRLVELVTYDEPCTGSSAYGAAYRAERLDMVAQYVVGDALGILIGHSRGNITALDVLEGGDVRPHIKGLVGYTPVWLGEPIRGPQFAGSLLREALRMPGLAVTGGLPAMWQVAQNGRRQMRNRPLYQADLQSIFAQDSTDRMVHTSTVLPTYMVLAQRDGLVPVRPVRQRLEQRGFRGKVSEIPTSHTGAMTAIRHCARPLFEAIVAVADAPFGTIPYGKKANC